MSVQGCDYAWERPDPQALVDEGFRFVVRYISYDTTGKNITPDELARLLDHGLGVVLNWEYAPRAALLGYPQGVRDGIAAREQAEALGWPAGRPVYFSVDFDATPDELDTVHLYLDGVASTLSPYQDGVYGSYRVVVAMLNRGACDWAWQTYAWSGGTWDTRAQLRQVANGVPFGPDHIDIDEAWADDYGAVFADTPIPPEPTWTEQLMNDLPLVRQGNTGVFVRRVQSLLVADGHNLAIDGDFGPITSSTVRWFQTQHGLTIDGVVGPHTWTALLTA